MKRTRAIRTNKWAVTVYLGLLLARYGAAEQFVELSVNLETVDFYYPDQARFSPADGGQFPGSTTNSQTLRCVVGADRWLIAGEPGTLCWNARVTFWFTGTNVVEHDVITSVPDDEKFAGGSFPPIGHRVTRVSDSTDGNPGRPVRAADLMSSPARTCWLAFCSGSFLKQPGRRVFPPRDLWKEFIIDSDSFPDETTVFKDGLGLPRTIKAFAKTNQVILEYQVRQSTNVLGWNFPLEFEMTQYNPAGTNGWKALSTAAGRVTAIGAGHNPEVPPDVFKYRQDRGRNQR